MMKPTSVEGKIGEWIIVHTCEKCGYQKRNKVAKEDGLIENIKHITTMLAKREYAKEQQNFF